MNKQNNLPAKMTTAVQSDGLTTREEQTRELSTASAAAAAQYEIQGMLTVAMHNPRNEDDAMARLMKSCARRLRVRAFDCRRLGTAMANRS